MTFDRFPIFIEVAERGHVLGAAEGARRARRWAASPAVAALNTAYQIKLFETAFAGASQVTETGRIILRESPHAVLKRTAMARSVLQDGTGGPSGPVAIAASQTIATYWLPRPRLAALRAANPRVRFNVMIRNSHDVETAVVEGEAGVGLVEGPTQHPALIRQQIDHDDLVLVAAYGRAVSVAD